MGTAIAIIVGAGWTYFTYFDSAERIPPAQQIAKTSPQQSPKPSPAKQENPEPKLAEKIQSAPVTKKPVIEQDRSFSGVYVGISTEGFLKQPIKITFEKKGNISKGTYTLSGMLGTMNGTINGNTYKYSWQLGGFSGKGISYFRGNTIEGTWGYANSDSNGGTLTAQLQ